MLANRHNQQIFHKAFESPFITALLGPRRVGKTTLIREFIKQHPNYTWVLLNMDIMSTRQAVERGELKDLIEQQSQTQIGSATKIWVAIDEAQKAPAVFDQIKVLYDEFKDQDVIKFILTGSAVLNLHQLSAESLAGRVFIYRVRPFNLRETLMLQQQINIIEPTVLNSIILNNNSSNLEILARKLNPYKSVLQNALLTNLIWGNFPETLDLTDIEERKRYLANYIQTYLEKDIRPLTTVTDLNLYYNLMAITAQQTGSIRDDTKLMSTLGCSRDTLKKYRNILTATLLYTELYPYIESTIKRLQKSPKGYLQDNGLIAYLNSMFDYHILKQNGNIGIRLENWFLNEIHVTLDAIAEMTNIYFWRSGGGAEIDFIVKVGTNIYPFEITHNHKLDNKKQRNLINFMQREKIATGFYIYSGNYHYDKTTGIHFIPAWML